MNFVKKHYVFILPAIWGLPWLTLLTPVVILVPDNGFRSMIAALVLIIKAGALALQVLFWLLKNRLTRVV